MNSVVASLPAVLTAILSLVGGGYSLVRYRLRLRFLAETFKRHGDRQDLEVAGKVTAPGWMAWGHRWCEGGPEAQPDQPPAERVLRAAP